MKYFYPFFATVLRILSIPLAVVGVFTAIGLIGFLLIDLAQACSRIADDLNFEYAHFRAAKNNC